MNSGPWALCFWLGRHGQESLGPGHRPSCHSAELPGDVPGNARAVGQPGRVRSRPDDRRLILAESAIDALSHAVLFPDAEDQTRYASLGGKPNSKQPGLLQTTIALLPEGSEIVAAFDADEAGRMLVEVSRRAVANVVSRTGRVDLIFQVHLPAQEGDDWNQVLQRTSARIKHPPLRKRQAG